MDETLDCITVIVQDKAKGVSQLVDLAILAGEANLHGSIKFVM